MSQYAAFFSKNTKFRICLFRYPLKLPPKANVVMINQNCTWPTPHFCCNLLMLFIMCSLISVKIGPLKPQSSSSLKNPPSNPKISSNSRPQRSSFFRISSTRFYKIYSHWLDAYKFMTFVT